MAVPDETPVDVLKGQFRIIAPAVNTGQIVIAAFLLCLCPGGLVKGVICLIRSVLHQQGETQVQVGLTVIGIRVPAGHARNGGAEKGLCLIRFAPAHQEHAIGVVGADVTRIALQRFQIIGIRQVGGMTVLFQMKTGQEQFLAAADLRRFFGGRHGIRDGLNGFGCRFVPEQGAAAGLKDKGQLGFRTGNADGCLDEPCGAQDFLIVINDLITGHEGGMNLHLLCHIHGDPGPAVHDLEIERAFL